MGSQRPGRKVQRAPHTPPSVAPAPGTPPQRRSAGRKGCSHTDSSPPRPCVHAAGCSWPCAMTCVITLDPHAPAALGVLCPHPLPSLPSPAPGAPCASHRPVALPLPERRVCGIAPQAAFPRWRFQHVSSVPSHSPMAMRVRAPNTPPLSGAATVYLSTQLLKGMLVASRFWQL